MKKPNSGSDPKFSGVGMGRTSVRHDICSAWRVEQMGIRVLIIRSQRCADHSQTRLHRWDMAVRA